MQRYRIYGLFLMLIAGLVVYYERTRERILNPRSSAPPPAPKQNLPPASPPQLTNQPEPAKLKPKPKTEVSALPAALSSVPIASLSVTNSDDRLIADKLAEIPPTSDTVLQIETVSQDEPKLLPAPNWANERWRRGAVALLMSIGAILLLLAARRFAILLPHDIPPSSLWELYGLGALLWIIGGYLLTKPLTTPQPPRWVWLALAGILLLALFLRAYDIENLPYGLWIDEAAAGIEAVRMSANRDYRPMFVDGIHVTGLQLHTYFASVLLFGAHNLTGLRMINVLWGVLGVWAAYGVGRELRSPQFGLLMAFILAVTRWSINFSRVGMTGIDNIFFVLLTTYFALRVVKYGRARDVFGISLAVGLGLWFYASFRFALIPLGLFVLIYWPYWKQPRRTLLLFGMAGASMLLLLLPLGIFAQENPDLFYKRSRETVIFHDQNRDPIHSVGDVLRFNVPRYLEMFHVEGDGFGRHNLPRAPMLDPLSGLLMLVGLWYAAGNRYHPYSWLFLGIIAAGLFTGIITVLSDTPQANRSGAAVVGVVFLCALAVERWSILLGRYLPQRAVYALFGLLLLGVAGLNIHTYFERYRYDYQAWASFATGDKLFVDAYLESQAAGPVWVSNYSPSYAYSLMGNYLVPGLAQTANFDSQSGLPLRTQGSITLLLMGDESNLLDYIARLYPNARIETVREDAPNLQNRPSSTLIIFHRLSIPAEDIQRLHGLDDGEGYLYVPQYGDYRLRALSGQLYLDGVALDDDRPITLYQGLHPIRVESDEANPNVVLRWLRPDEMDFEGILRTYLFNNIGALHGLRGEYFGNLAWQGEPIEERLVLSPNISELGVTAQHELISSARWTGTLNISENGLYQFRLHQSGEIEIYINGQELFKTDEPYVRLENQMELAAGDYAFEVRFKHPTSNGHIQLMWLPPQANENEWRAIPADHFSPF